jgi:hypothetical protein
VKKQDSERKHRFIPWSPCETHVTNAVKTKRSRDACGPTCSENTTTPAMQVSRLHNKRVQNEAGGTPKSSSVRVESPSTADEAGLPGSMPPKNKLAPEALGALAGAEIANGGR